MNKIIALIIMLLLSVNVFSASPPSPLIPRSSDSTVADIWNGFRIGSGGLGYNRVYNVKNLGAKGDGTTSDYHAFDSAITLITADTMGGAIYIPPGQYLIDTMLFAVQSPIKRFYMYGHGSASRILVGDSGFIQVGSNTAEDGSGRWYFKDFEIANSASNSNGKYGISLREGGTFGIQNVNVYGAGSSDYLDYAFYIVSSQQGSISDLYIKQCVTGIELTDTTIGTHVNPNQVILDRIFLAGGGEANSLYGIVYNGSQTGVLSNSHLTACSTLVSIDSGQGLVIENTHLETGRTGIVVHSGSNNKIINNTIYTVDTSLYLAGGNKTIVEGNLFNTEVILGAGATKNSIIRNLFSQPIVDSTADTVDNRNRYFGNLNQSTGDAYQGLKLNTQTGDANDFYLLSTGDIEAYLKGVDSTYIKLFASGDGIVGLKLEDYHRIFATANSGDGIQFATYDTTTGADTSIVHFQLKGAHPYPQAIFKDISGLKIGEYTLDTADGTNGQVLKTDGSGNVTWQDDATGAGGAAVVVEDAGTLELGATDTLNFDNGFDLANSGDGQVDVDVDTTAIATVGHAEAYADSARDSALSDIRDTIAVVGGGAWTQNDGNDSLRLIQKNGTDTLFYIDADTTNDTVKLYSDYDWIFGSEGMTIIDSLQINGRWQFMIGTDSIMFPRTAPSDNDILVYDNAGDSLGWEAQSGGSGTTDSAYVADTILPVVNYWLTPEDTLFIDTTQYLALQDTADLWKIDSFFVDDTVALTPEGWVFSGDTLFHDTTQSLALQDTADFHTVIDSANEVLIGDSLTEIWNDLALFDTNYVYLIGDTISATKMLADTIVLGDDDTLVADEFLSYGVKILVHNATGATLPQNTPVYIVSNTGTIPNVDSARADNASMMPCIGLLSADIANGSDGYAVFAGYLSKLNTGSYSVGDQLYVAPTGGLTTTKPVNSHKIQKMGQVIRSNAGNGIIYVSGANRSNDVPNFEQGTNYIWAGGSDSSAIEIDLDSAIAITIDTTTTIDSTNIPDASVAWNDLDTNGQDISHLGQSITGTEITNQTIAKADIDSTSSNLIFNDAYRVTSAVPDSILATKGYVDANVGGWDWADSAGEPPYWVDSATYATYADSAGNVSKDFITGNLTVRNLEMINFARSIDLAQAHAYIPDTFLRIKVYDGAITDARDSFQSMHCNVAYLPGGFPKSRTLQYNEWLIYTPLVDGGSATEQICISVWDEEQDAYIDTFLIDTSVAATYDTIRNVNPILDTADFSGGGDTLNEIGYLSDPFIGVGHDGALYALIRASYTAYGDGGNAWEKIYAIRSEDGVNWSDTNLLINGLYETNDIPEGAVSNGINLIAPSFVIGENGKYIIFATADTGNNPLPLGIWETDDLMDGEADMGQGIDTFTFGDAAHTQITFAIADLDYPGSLLGWHTLVSAISPDVLLAFGVNTTTGDSLMGFISRDGGRHWEGGNTISRIKTIGGGATLNNYTYSGYPIFEDDRFYFKGFLTGKFDSTGISNEYHTRNMNLYFGAGDYEDISATIYDPDAINDTVPIFRVDPTKYPDGIVIQQIDMSVFPSASYTLPILVFDSTHAIQDTVEFMATSSSTYDWLGFKDIDQTEINAGDYIFFNLPATDIDHLNVKIIYYAK